MTKHPDDHKQFLAEFDRGDTHAVLAERYGVNRGTIRHWLRAAGVDPQLNVKRRREAKRKLLENQLRQIERLQGQREQAMLQLQSIADQHRVKPLTLAHWYEGTGHYTPGVKVNLRAGRPRRLPARRSHQAAVLRAQVERACRPWEPRTVAGLLRDRKRELDLAGE